MSYKIHKLANGLTILFVPKDSAESVIVDTFVKIGSRNEDERTNGISHFLEHLNFKGTKKYSTPRKLAEAVDSKGGSFNAFTGNEYTHYLAHMAAKHIDTALEIVTELFRYPRLRAKDIEREKGVIIEEMNMYKDTPSRYVFEVMSQAMWKNHSLGRSILGTEKVIKSLNRADVVNYRKEKYSPLNTIVAVGGKFNEKKVLKSIEKLWKDYDGALPPASEPAENAQQDILAVHKKKTNQAHFIIGFKSVDKNHPMVPAITILSNILGGSMSSRLFEEIREKRALAYYVGTDEEYYEDAGEFIARAGVEKNNIKTALEVMVKELGKIKKTLVKTDELKKAKEHYKGNTILENENLWNEMQWYMEEVRTNEDKIITPEAWLRKIDRVTAKDVRAAAQFLFNKEKMTLAVLGPYGKSDEEEFEKIIGRI